MPKTAEKINYPFDEHVIHTGLSWRNTTLYSICGWASSWFGSKSQFENAIAFGGFLQLGDDSYFRGSLIDFWGQSCIEGDLTEATLNFVKQYFGGHLLRLPIEYNLTKDDDLWVGTFKFNKKEGGRVGRTECKIDPVIPNSSGLLTFSGNGELEESREYARRNMKR